MMDTPGLLIFSKAINMCGIEGFKFAASLKGSKVVLRHLHNFRARWVHGKLSYPFLYRQAGPTQTPDSIRAEKKKKLQ